MDDNALRQLPHLALIPREHQINQPLRVRFAEMRRVRPLLLSVPFELVAAQH